MIKRRCLKSKVFFSVWATFWKNNCACPLCGKKGETINNEPRTARINGYIPFHIHHVIPLSKGGTDEENNLRVVCRSCNLSEGNKYGSTSHVIT